ncbi:hypothetical protein BH23ACT5_BH23ACT5_10460 [soil metagenome]
MSVKLGWFYLAVIALVATAIVAVVSFLGSLAGLVRPSIGPVLVVGRYGLVPVAVVVAILRYRLFDIDRLVSRAVTYIIVVSFLAAFYAGSVVGLRRWLPGEGQIPVAASTLAVAACFLPLATR